MNSPDARLSGAPRTTRARSILRWCWVGLLGLGLLFWLGASVLLDITTSVDEQGMLHEPFFWTIPMAWLCALCGCALGLVDLLIGLFSSLSRRRRS